MTEDKLYKLTDLLLAIMVVILQGLAISHIWEWFMVPLGVISIGFVHAIGLTILGSAFTYKFRYDPLRDELSSLEKATESLIQIVAIVVIFITAAVTHVFM